MPKTFPGTGPDEPKMIMSSVGMESSLHTLGKNNWE